MKQIWYAIFLLAFLFIQSPHVSGETITIDLPHMPSGAYPLEMIHVPAGSYVHELRQGVKLHVTLTQDFYLSKYEITQAQWEAVMGFNPSRDCNHSNRPVEMVSWPDCQDFARRLSLHHSGEFRLPTVAEWLYAAKAGTTTKFYWGDEDDFDTMNRYEWWEANTKYSSSIVGLKLPNPWGFYDVLGNVHELCYDKLPYYTVDTHLIDPIHSDPGFYHYAHSGGSYFSPIRNYSIVTGGGGTSAFPWMGFRLYRSSGAGTGITPTPTPHVKPTGTPTFTPTPRPDPVFTPTPFPTLPPRIDFIGDLNARYDTVRYGKIDRTKPPFFEKHTAPFKAFFPPRESSISGNGNILLTDGKILFHDSGRFSSVDIPNKDRMFFPALHRNGKSLSYSVRLNPNVYEYRVFDIERLEITAKRRHREILAKAPGFYFPDETMQTYAVSPDLRTMVFNHPAYPYHFICRDAFSGTSKAEILARGHGIIPETPSLISLSSGRIFFHGFLPWLFTNINHFLVEENDLGWTVPNSLSLPSSWQNPIKKLFDISDDGKTALVAENREFFLIHETETGWDRFEMIGCPYREGDQGKLSGDGTVAVTASQRRQDIWVGRSIYDIFIHLKQDNGEWISLRGNDEMWAEPDFLFSKDGSTLYWTSVVPWPTPTVTPTRLPGTGIPQNEWLLHE